MVYVVWVGAHTFVSMLRHTWTSEDTLCGWALAVGFGGTFLYPLMMVHISPACQVCLFLSFIIVFDIFKIYMINNKFYSQKFPVCLGQKSPIIYMICKYFLPLSRLPFLNIQVYLFLVFVFCLHTC